MAKGVIYILTNPSFLDYVKIGYADNLKKEWVNWIEVRQFRSHSGIMQYMK